MKYFRKHLPSLPVARFVISIAAVFVLSFSFAEAREAKQSRKFSFELSAETASALEQGVKRLKLNDSVESVVKILGKPSSDVNLFKPRLFRRSQFVARCLTYNLKLVETSAGNVNDQQILLYFDEHDLLTGIVKSGVPQPNQVPIQNNKPRIEKIL